MKSSSGTSLNWLVSQGRGVVVRYLCTKYIENPVRDVGADIGETKTLFTLCDQSILMPWTWLVFILSFAVIKVCKFLEKTLTQGAGHSIFIIAVLAALKVRIVMGARKWPQSRFFNISHILYFILYTLP